LISNLPLVFFFSGVLRLCVSVGLLSSLRESRTVEPISFGELCWELPLVKPLSGVFMQGTRQVALVRNAAPQLLTALSTRGRARVLKRQGQWIRRHYGGKWKNSHSGDPE
jgi:hypothetical protein